MHLLEWRHGCNGLRECRNGCGPENKRADNFAGACLALTINSKETNQTKLQIEMGTPHGTPWNLFQGVAAPETRPARVMFALEYILSDSQTQNPMKFLMTNGNQKIAPE